MADDMERELSRILEADEASENRIEQLQQQLGELTSKVQVLADATVQQVTSTIVTVTDKVASIQTLPSKAAQALTSVEGAVPQTEVEEVLRKYLAGECEVIKSEVAKLEKAAGQLQETIKSAFAPHMNELCELLDQAQHDDVCMRELAHLLAVDSTQVVEAVKWLLDDGQVEQQSQTKKSVLPKRKPLLFTVHSGPQRSGFQNARNADSSATTAMETDEAQCSHDQFRSAFRLLKSGDITNNEQLQELAFDAVQAAEGGLASRRLHSTDKEERVRFQNADVANMRPQPQALPSALRDSQSRGMSPPLSETNCGFDNGVGVTLAAMALPEVKNFTHPDGKGFSKFVTSFSMKYGRIGLTDDMLIHLMSEKLEGHPKAVMESLPEYTRHGKFADFVAALTAKFAESTSAKRMESHVRLKQLRMTKSVAEYCVELERLTRDANPDASETDLSMTRASELIAQLTQWPEYFQLFASMEAAAPYEAYDRLKTLAQSIERSKKVAQAVQNAAERKGLEDAKKPRKLFLFRKDKERPPAAETAQPMGGENRQPLKETTASPATSEDKGRKCLNCGQPGHFRRDCKEKQRESDHESTAHQKILHHYPRELVM